MQRTQTKLKIDWTSHEAADFACRNWHYSHSVPVPPIVKIGVWEDSRFIGVVLFSRGASSNLSKPYGLSQTECCELTRVALTNHNTPVSKILSIAIKFLKKNSPGMRLIVSFADSNQGHHGGIYQATNWIYSGKSSDSYKYIDNAGNEWHSRQVSEKGFNIQMGLIRKCPKPSECKKIYQTGKHRYLMPLDKEIGEKIKVLSQPYPKRAESIENDAASFHEEKGSVILTSAHQFEKDKNNE